MGEEKEKEKEKETDTSKRSGQQVYASNPSTRLSSSSSSSLRTGISSEQREEGEGNFRLIREALQSGDDATAYRLCLIHVFQEITKELANTRRGTVTEEDVRNAAKRLIDTIRSNRD